MSSKIYGRVPLTEDELLLIRRAINNVRVGCFDKWYAVGDSESDEKKFYAGKMDECDALSKKLEQPFKDDTSQDAFDTDGNEI